MKNTTTIDDGGPAFPFECVQFGANGEPAIYSKGMSLRDYFAAHAMQASCFQQFAVAIVKAIKPDDQRVTLAIAPETTARCAYKIADAMIAARKAVRP